MISVKQIIVVILVFCPLFSFTAGSTPQNATRDDLSFYLEKAVYYDDLGKFDSSLIYYDSAFQSAKLFTDPSFKASVFLSKGTMFISIPAFDSAVYYLQKAATMAEEHDNDTIEINALLNMGYVLFRQGDNDSAMRLYQMALEQAESANYHYGQGKAYNLLNILYKNKGDYENGLETAIKTLYLYEQLGDTKNQIKALIGLANIYEKLGKDDSAYAIYKLTYEMSKAQNDAKNELISMFNMGVIDINKGQKFEGEGNVDSARSRYLHAKRIYEQALQTSIEKSDQSTVSECYNSLARVYVRINKYDSAAYFAGKAYRLAAEIDDAHQELNALETLGESHYFNRDLHSAKSYYQLCLIRARDVGKNELLMRVSKALSEIYEQERNYVRSLEYYKKYIQYKDSLFSIEKEKLIKEHEANFEILRLKEARRIESLRREKVYSERNLSMKIGALVVVSLLGLLVYFRMRAKKNRIISEQKILKLEDEKKLLAAQSVILGQEEERRRIATELHDGIGVLLSSARIQFSSLDDNDPPEKARQVVQSASKMVADAGIEVRKIAHNMMPGVLSKLGLRDALEDLFDELEESGTIETNVKMRCSKMRLPENMEIMIYRIVQEMINNTLTHASASCIDFSISRDDDGIEIIYKDNGIGFDEQKIPTNKGLGLYNIRTRVDFLSGNVSLKSNNQSGTYYKVTIPIHQRMRK